MVNALKTSALTGCKLLFRSERKLQRRQTWRHLDRRIFLKRQYLWHNTMFLYTSLYTYSASACRLVFVLTGPAGWRRVAGIVDPSLLSNAWVAFLEESDRLVRISAHQRATSSEIGRYLSTAFFFHNVVQSCCFMVAAECWLRRWCGLVHTGLRYGKRRNMCLYSTENTLIYSLRITVS